MGSTRSRDTDMDDDLNLVCGILHLLMAYPSVGYNKTPKTIFPSGLFIGDSFYYTWSEAGYIPSIFSGRDFWYYDHDVFFGSFNTGRKTQVLNRQNEPAKNKSSFF
jgi:hypothetical protein